VDLTDSESGHDDKTDSRSGGQAAEGDLTDSRHDLTDFGDDLTDSRELPDRPVGHNPVVNPVVKPVVKPGRSPAASDFSSPPETAATTATATDPSLAATPTTQTKQPHVRAAEQAEQERLLAGLEADLARKPKDPATLRAVETVRAELADAGDLAAVAGVELLPEVAA
jgi:hypothetical protein